MNSPKFLLAVLLALAVAFAACRRDEDLAPQAPLTPEQLQSIAMCSTVEPITRASLDTVYGTADGVSDRAAGQRLMFWDRGAVLKVKLIGATPVVRETVKYYAQQWSMHANVGFDFVSSGEADIRVTFDLDGGNWSEVGKRASFINENQPSMNLVLHDLSSQEEFRRYTLHEFGHALGLVHEHKSPVSNIPWNLPNVYTYYMLTQGWSVPEIDQNVLGKYSVDDVFYTAYDKHSIMHYPVDPFLTTGGFSVPWNTQLSSKDKSFIHQMYTTEGVTITNKYAGYNGDIRLKVNGIWYILGKDERVKVYIPASASPMTVSMLESDNNQDWFLDTNHSVQHNKNYKIVQDGGYTRFKLVQVP